jgi:ABC-type nitrate/sulfonate/bicarbonate transport system substrate-binding protein
MKKTIILVLLTGIIFCGCQEKKEKLQASLRFDWFTSMTFSGEVWGAGESADKYGITIKLEPGSETTDPIKLVLSGANDFGCISLDRLLAANEKGAQLVAIGVINQLSPTVFIAKKVKNIKTPKDWIGKKVGVLPGGATEYVYRSLLQNQGLQSSQFKEVTVPFDLGTFIADQYDVRPAFIYDEPISMDQQKIAYDLIEPKNYGVKYVGRVYFARKDFITAHPDVAQAFINAMEDGWRSSLANPVKAISLLKKFEPKTDTVRELMSLKKALPYFYDQQNKVLTFNRKEWDGTVADLIKLGAIKKADLKDVINDTYINNVNSKQ